MNVGGLSDKSYYSKRGMPAIFSLQKHGLQFEACGLMQKKEVLHQKAKAEKKLDVNYKPLPSPQNPSIASLVLRGY